MVKRRNFTDQYEARVALEALLGDKTVQEIATKHQLQPNQVSVWKRQAIDGIAMCSLAASRTVRPPPLPGINAAPRSYSSFARELLNA